MMKKVMMVVNPILQVVLILIRRKNKISFVADTGVLNLKFWRSIFSVELALFVNPDFMFA